MPWGEATPGTRLLLQGNAALARGALEGGVRFCASYPGSPSSEVVEILIRRAPAHDLYVEWSANEKVAAEAAWAAAQAGLRSLVVMKANGLNVALDAVTGMGLAGCRGAGLVLLVCDDPAGHSSTNELDSRHQAAFAGLPLLEPGGFQSAKDLLAAAFSISEACALPVLTRSVTRICHARGVVTLGELPPTADAPAWSPERRVFTYPVVPHHQAQQQALARAGAAIADAGHDEYTGPEHPATLIIAAGTGVLYANEAIRALDLADQVGCLAVTTVHPLPEDALAAALGRAPARVLFLEEIAPVLEDAVRAWSTTRPGPAPALLGVRDGSRPGRGELGPDLVRDLLGGLHPAAGRASQSPLELTAPEPPPRDLAFCPGCPHKASFLVLHRALALDGREAIVTGDIGCYSLAFGPAGFQTLDTVTVMGAGVGHACGLGQLGRFGLDRPVVSVVGDSTFFHAGVEPLISARFNAARFLYVVLDNCATAMTGFQPHPGSDHTALGAPAAGLRPEQVLAGLDVPVQVLDPFAVQDSSDRVVEALAGEGLRAVVFRRECVLAGKRAGRSTTARATVDPARCRGEDCGCGLYCVRTFACPALRHDPVSGRAAVDPLLCTGCEVCVQICPAGAIAMAASGGERAAPGPPAEVDG